MRRAPAAFVALVALVTVGVVTPSTPTGAAAAAPLVTDPVALVDPLVGTTGGPTYGGHTSPAATVPFGMVQWGPDTTSRPPGGGYDHADTATTGFSLTHLSGPGCAAFGDVPILPVVGPIGASGLGGVPLGTTSQPFAHSSEVATPGAYSVTVGTPGIRTDLAATTRAGVGTFTFPPTTAANVLVKAGSSAAGNDAAGVLVIGSDTIATTSTSGHFCGSAPTYTVYSVIQFSRPFTSFGAWTGAGTQPGGRVATGAGGGAYATFDTRTAATVTARVGISFVSVAGAMANLAAEIPGWDVAGVRTAARAAWAQRLGRIQIGGGTADQQRTFYTALYHSLLHPNVFSDADGSYVGFDGQVRRATAGTHYANISGWDVYRTQIPLLAWIAPTEASAIVQSMIDDARQRGGRLPKWSLANAETYTMVGDPAAPIIASTAAFGARGFSLPDALTLLVNQATVASDVRPGLDEYVSKGYLPIDASYGCCSFSGPVATALEYQSADFAISRLATMSGNASVAATFTRRAGTWTILLQARDGLFQQRYASGQFLPGPNPTTQFGFIEGNALQHAWAVPHDLGGLINAIGGRTVAVSRLDQLFTALNSGPSEPTAFLANEPSFATPYAYVAAGAPGRTADVVARIRSELFGPTPNGLPGNDDLGATSAWYVWSALGLYPSVPGTADLILGTPQFPNAVIRSGLGPVVTINAPAVSPSARYVGALRVDGVASNRSWIPAAKVLAGTTLDLTMTSTPGAFGTAAADAPPSYPPPGRSVVGFSDPSGTAVIPPATARPIVIGATNLTAATQAATWTTSVTPVLAPAGATLTATPAAGALSVPPSGRASVPVTVRASAGGVWDVRVTLTVGGVAVAPVVVRVVAAAPGDLGPHADNAGTSDDANRAAASLDFTNFSYSRQALASVGIVPGGTVTVGGLTYRWPAATGGTPDNVVAAGQRIDLAPRPGATRLGVLGSSTNAGAGAQGTATITYTDGTTATATIGFTDWTRAAGTVPVGFANQVVATTPYVNCQCNVSWPMPASIYQATVPVDPARTVASITLPARVSAGDLHVFALALG